MKQRLAHAINNYINRDLHNYEHDRSLWDRLKLWYRYRMIYSQTLIFWHAAWWIPGLRWLWRLWCRNVTWRIERHNRRAVAKAPNMYDWSREGLK